jgi:hypothetical protein
MFCFEKTVFKTFKLFLEYLIFRKTVLTVRSKFSLHVLNLVCTKVVNNTNTPYKDRHSIFGKTNVTGQIFKFISHRCRLSFHLESLFAGYAELRPTSFPGSFFGEGKTLVGAGHVAHRKLIA